MYTSKDKLDIRNSPMTITSAAPPPRFIILEVGFSASAAAAAASRSNTVSPEVLAMVGRKKGAASGFLGGARGLLRSCRVSIHPCVEKVRTTECESTRRYKFRIV
jgi:hypothetical protein